MDPSFRGLPAPVPKAIKTKRFDPKIIFLFIGGVLLAAAMTVIFVVMSENDSRYNTLRLSWRLDNLNQMLKTSQDNTQSSNMRKLNSEISVLVTGDYNEIVKLLPASKIDPKAKEYREAERTRAADLMSKLNTARVNGVFDREYKPVLRAELLEAQKLAERVRKASSNKDLRTALETFSDHINTSVSHIDAL